MAIETGINSQLAIASESTWKTGVTVTRFLPHADVHMTQQIARVESKGIIAGRLVLDSLQSAASDISISGNVKMEAYDHGQGLWWSHALGGAAISGAGPYTQTYTPSNLTGKSFTLQYGYPDIGGTVRAFTYAGCKISKWQLDCQAGQIADLSFDITAATETTATSLATASYTSTLNPLVYTQGAITGVSNNISKISVMGDNKLADKRRVIGSSTILEQLDSDLRDYTFTLETEFASLTDYQRYTTFGASAPVVLTFTSGSNTLTVTMNCRFDGDSPVMKGRGIVGQTLKGKCVGTTDAAAITVVTVNSDATA